MLPTPLLIYVAGPYTHPDPVDNTRRAIEVGNRIMESGYCVPHIPHLTMLWHFHTPRPVEEWYQYDLAILARCDALLRIEGASTGADAEVAFAVKHRIAIWHDVDVMLRCLHPDSLAAPLGGRP